MKFDTIIDKYLLDLLTEALPTGGLDQNGGPQLPPDPGPQGGQAPQAQAPQPPAAPEPPQQLTSEGKKFLVELCLKALAFSPDNISAQDKSIFETQVTTGNADQIADRIRQIIDGM